MPIYIHLLALTTALAWGSGAILIKKGFSMGGNRVQASVIVVGVNVLSFWIVFWMWKGLDDALAHISWSTIGLFALAGLFGNALGRFLALYGIDQLGVTINTAGISTRPLFAATIAVIWLGEQLQPFLLIGILLVVIGIITIVMGTKLTVAANHLEFAIQNKDQESFTIAVDQLRQYFLINGILLIVTVALIGLGIILLIFFAGFFMDLINESGFDYSIITLSLIHI